MARSKKEVEAIMAGLGVAVSVWDAMLKKGRDKGLGGEDFYFLVTPEGDEALNEFVKVVSRSRGPRSATPFTDAEALDRWGSEIDGLKDMLKSYRAMASVVFGLDSEVKIVWEIPAGFTIWNAPQVGPCYKKWEYMKDWSVPDEATRHCLAFLPPRLVPESTDKNVEEQMNLLVGISKNYNLPKDHLAGYGNAALLSILILSHYKQTGERVPLEYRWARTDTRLSDGRRLSLGDFDSDGLSCGCWHWDENRYPNLGCFALGVEKLGD